MALRVVAGLTILVAVLAVGTLAVLQTDAGRRNAAGLIGWAASDDSGGIALDGLAVDWDLDLRLASLVVRDADGPYLAVSGLDVAWRPLALFTGLVAIDNVSVERVALSRLPVPGPNPTPGTALAPGLPALPAIHLDAASVERIELGQPSPERRCSSPRPRRFAPRLRHSRCQARSPSRAPTAPTAASTHGCATSGPATC
ncbi:MAG: hypothetical protein HPM95_14980 [Alphaproteobacteria bacterium]|nr:hypothetical protein [Alphaproteobacteria bacterium]